MRLSLTCSYKSPTGRELGGGPLGDSDLKEIDRPDVLPTTMAALLNLVPWHLNDVQAACAHQTVLYESSPYGRRPSLSDTLPCPVSGYRYGSAWLVKPLTAEVVELARSLGCVVPVGGTVYND